MKSNPASVVTSTPQEKEFASRADEITLLIRRLIQAYKVYSKQFSKQYHVSAPQMHCLLALYEKGALHPTLIARNIAVKASTVTGILDRLEKKGMVVRLRNLKDRRRIGIQLTDMGKRVVEEGPQPLREYLANGLKKLSGNEAERIVESLIRLTGILESRGALLNKGPDHSIS